MIWLKKFIFTNLVEQRGATFPRPFSGKTNSLKIKHLKKIHFFIFFLISEYGNLTSVKTYRDRLKILGKTLLNRRFNFFDFGRGWGICRGFRCFLVVDLLFALPVSLWKFPHFCSRLPFSGFHPRVIFFIFIFFLTVLLCTWQFKIHLE